MVKASIIIPTLNRADSLALTLKSLVKQNFSDSDYEIIIVDNGSTDHTRAIFQEVCAKNTQHNISYFYEPIPGSLSARHRGALESKGEILVFIDDDIDTDVGWLKAFVTTFEDSSIQLAGGKNLPKYEAVLPSWVEGFLNETPYGGKSCTDLSLLDLGEEMIDIDANYIWTLNLAIRRKALYALGGFHPDIFPGHLQHLQGDGETGLTRKANEKGYRAVYQPKAVIYHRIPASRLTPEYFEKRAYFQGVCDSYTEIRQGSPLHLSKSPVKRLARYAKRPAYHGIRLIRRLFFRKPVDPFLAEIKKNVNQAYNSGFMFHQKALQDNEQLLQWIIKEDYWDYRLPDLKHEEPKHDINTMKGSGVK